MDQWIQTLLSILDIVTRHPQTRIEQVFVIILSFAAFLIVYRIVAAAFGFSNTGKMLSFTIAVIGLLLMLGASAAVIIFMPKAGLFVAAGGSAAVLLVIIMPLACYLQKGKYIAALFSWVISIGAMIGVILLVRAGVDAFVSGSKQAEKAIIHKEKMEDFLDKQTK